jgi:hypothetical protein
MLTRYCVSQAALPVAAQPSIVLDEFLRRRVDQLLLNSKTARQGFDFLEVVGLNVERDNAHSFISGEIGLCKPGSAISADADIGHRLAFWQELHPIHAKFWIILLK